MIWILLLYVLPLVLSTIVLYFFIKQEEETVKKFLEVLPWLIIPLFNIAVVIAGLFFIVHEWLENDDKWQDFLNRKL